MLVVALLIGMITNGIDNAQAKPPNAKVRAIQNDNSLDMGNAGILGEDIYCVGGIDASSNANDIHCYLLPDGVPTNEYKDPTYAGVVVKIDGDSTNIDECPEDAGFKDDDICFWVLFPAANFPTEGHYRFVAEFTEDGDIIDIAGVDWRNHSFMVVPEAILGALAILGSMFAVFTLYMKRRN